MFNCSKISFERLSRLSVDEIVSCFLCLDDLCEDDDDDDVFLKEQHSNSNFIQVYGNIS